MSPRIPRILGTACLIGAFFLILGTVGIYHLSGHAAWFADTMYRKGGLHEMSAEDLHKHLVDAKWSIHALHVRYLVSITVLVAALGVVLVLSSRAVGRIEQAKSWPNKRPDGTSAKAPPSNPSQVSGAHHL